MKNFKILIICFISFSSTYSYSATITNLEIESNESKKEINLNIESKGSGSIKIRIWDKKKCLLDNDYEALNSFQKTIDLSSQSTGVYSLEIEDDFEVKSYHLIVSQNGAKVDESSLIQNYKPIFVFEENSKRLKVNWLMDTTDHPKVIILNNYGDLIFKRTFDKVFTFNKQLDLRLYKPGKYTAIIKNSNYSYEYEINL